MLSQKSAHAVRIKIKKIQVIFEALIMFSKKSKDSKYGVACQQVAREVFGATKM